MALPVRFGSCGPSNELIIFKTAEAVQGLGKEVTKILVDVKLESIHPGGDRIMAFHFSLVCSTGLSLNGRSGMVENALFTHCNKHVNDF